MENSLLGINKLIYVYNHFAKGRPHKKKVEAWLQLIYFNTKKNTNWSHQHLEQLTRHSGKPINALGSFRTSEAKLLLLFL